MREWFAARLQAGMGETARMYLKKQGFGCYLPVGREWRVGRGGLALRPVSLFPGYVFVQFDYEVDRWQAINGTRGVVKLLPQHLYEPSALPPGFVEELQGLEADGALDAKKAEEVVYRFSVGEAGEVVSGPFAGLTGEFSRYHKGSLVLVMGLFGRKNELRFRPQQVRPVPERAAVPVR